MLENSEVQTLPKEDCDRLGIYKRQMFDPNAAGHKHQQDTSLADTTDSLSAEEAAITKVQYILDLFKQIPGVPMPERMGPRPVCPLPGMYMWCASITGTHVTCDVHFWRLTSGCKSGTHFVQADSIQYINQKSGLRNLTSFLYHDVNVEWLSMFARKTLQLTNWHCLSIDACA